MIHKLSEETRPPVFYCSACRPSWLMCASAKVYITITYPAFYIPWPQVIKVGLLYHDYENPFTFIMNIFSLRGKIFLQIVFVIFGRIKNEKLQYLSTVSCWFRESIIVYVQHSDCVDTKTLESTNSRTSVNSEMKKKI